MTLKSIELSGFKSFGKKSLVSFTTPITAVVGPNGSGKSNIVESIRFVLGEQSMKSLRGKGGVDLIFKGSKNLSHGNHAQVTITFDNSKKIFSFTNSGLGVSLDYDEVNISREVFADGVNKYSINGSEVRLKDVVDLLASVNIGSSGHHIISQGEADRVLNASSKDRRAMIEDALGLKVYQYRIKESERKLEKTLLNMKEIQALRREIAPHLAFLKKQVQMVEKARTMREELASFYKSYFSAEQYFIQKETKRLTHNRRELDEKSVSLDERINKLQSVKKEEKVDSEHTIKIKDYELELSNLRAGKDDYARSLGRIEGILEGLDRELSRTNEVKEKVISESEWKAVASDIEQKIDQALLVEDIPQMIEILQSIKHRLNSLHAEIAPIDNSLSEELENKYTNLKAQKDELALNIQVVASKESEIIGHIASLRFLEKESQEVIRDSERMLYELLREKTEVTSDMHSLSFEEEKLAQTKNAFEMEIAEAGALIGRDAMSYMQVVVENDVPRNEQEDLRRKIERIKIKLEDAGIGTGADILKEYEDTSERDSFLVKEVDDLTKSIDSLKLLIADLKETLDKEFKNGLEKINKQFQEFFALMFGGGGANLSVVVEHKKPRKSEDDDEDTKLGKDSSEGIDDENELEFERGIDINVSLPQKKVKDLHMLSGGERSLTSIALLFAISQVNPPPFLVLDETDAALDEANSRKYGNMLDNLSKYSQLVVVTHNRETMSHAQVLYGVTMDISGASKLLSIRLEDASTYAK